MRAPSGIANLGRVAHQVSLGKPGNDHLNLGNPGTRHPGTGNGTNHNESQVIRACNRRTTSAQSHVLADGDQRGDRMATGDT